MPLGILVRTRRVALIVCLGLCAIVTIALAGKPPIQVSPVSPGDGSWSFIPGTDPPPPTSSPPPRMLYGAAWDTPRERMIVFGGHPTFRNDTWVFASDAWQELVTSGTPPSPRYGHTAVYDAANDRLVVFGGLVAGNSLSNEVWTLSLSGTPTWSPLTTAGTPPSARFYSVVVYDDANEQLVLFGGYDGVAPFTEQSSAGFLGDTWTLSLGANPTWSNVFAGTPPPPRNLSHGIYDPSRQRMVIFGGWTGTHFLNDSWQLALDGTPTWSSLVAAGPPGPRRENSASYDPLRDRMIIFGGLEAPYDQLDETWALSFQTNEWEQLNTPPPPGGPRTAHESVYDPVADRLIAYGGYGSNAYLSSTITLSLTGPPAWEDPTVPASAIGPSRRREYSAVYDPAREQMLLFSGTQQSGPLDRAVWALPLADPEPEWVRHNLPGGPNPRHGHVAVWDAPRDRMLMFGGYDDVGLNYSNELWQLDSMPTPKWTLLTPTGTPPSTRMLCGMIHDPVRDRLIVIGGHPQYLNDVWALPLSGPNAMQWSQLSPLGTPPTPRWGFTVIYDPDAERAILFGGTSAGSVVHDDVWALNLTGGTSWENLDPIGPNPDPRLVHSAIYDALRKRMVVYGGGNYNPSFLADVWELERLDERPKWKKLHPDGVDPGERDLITSIYDEPRNRLVFFGGFHENPTTFFNDTWFLTWEGLETAESGSSVDVPAVPQARAVLALAGARPNPSLGDVIAEFTLPSRATARLALVDLAGRVVVSRDVGMLGPGIHRVDLVRGRSLPVGMYFIRLDSDGRSLRSKVTIVR